MLKLQMGRAYSLFDIDKIGAVVADVRKHFKGVTAEYFTAALPVSLTFSRPSKPKPSKPKDANYVVVKMRGKTILEFYGTALRANGQLFDERLNRQDFEKLSAVLANHDYYTFGMFKSMHPEIRLMCIVLGMMLVFMGTFSALAAAYNALVLFFASCTWVFGAGLLKLYT